MAKFLLDEPALRAHVGSQYFNRGRDYYQRNCVIGLTFSARDRVLFGMVRGSQPKPYRALISFNRKGIEFSTCSCPLGESCKHVAALGIAATKEIPRFKATTMMTDTKPNAKNSPEWRNILSNSIATAEQAGDLTYITSRDGRIHEPCYTETELVFRLVEVPHEPWDPENSSQFFLQVRPRVTHPETGKRSLTAVQWKDVRYGAYQHYRQDQAPLAPRAEKFLHLFSRQLELDTHYTGGRFQVGSAAAWVDVATSHIPLLWPLIEAHEEYGITLTFGENPSFPLSIAREPVTPIVIISDHTHGILIGKHMLLPGHEADTAKSDDTVILYGDPPTFAFIAGTQHTPDGNFGATFYPVAKKYDAAIFTSLEKPIHVPPEDIPEFTKRFLPELVRRVSVKNISPQIAVPEVVTPKLRATITKTGSTAIAVIFELRYGSRTIDLNDSSATDGTFDDRNMPCIMDISARDRLIKKLDAMARTYPWWHDISMSTDIPSWLALEKFSSAEFMRSALPNIAAWPETEILRDADVPNFDQLEDTPILTMQLTESVTLGNGAEGDWFDLAAKVTIGGRVTTLAQILSALSANEVALFLEDGSIIDLTQPFFIQLKELMHQAAQLPDPVSGLIQVSKFQAGWWDEFSKLGVVEKQTASWERSVGALLDVKQVPKLKVPRTLKAVLRPYQEEGLSWLAFLHDHRLGGILADDMGLGKTIQAIALICAIRVAERTGRKTIPTDTPRPFLIVAPTSVVENWSMEIARFAPHLRVIILRAGDRSSLHGTMSEADVIITSYALLWRDEEHYKNIAWDSIILDEAQQVKNHQSRAYAIIRQLSCHCRFALTGTPLENNTMELWSLCSIVAPGLFPPPERFREVFQRPIEKMADTAALQQLRRRVRPFILRRKKELVEKDLPAKTESVVLLDMEPAQRTIYDLFLQKQRQKILGLLASGGFREHRFEILSALTHLRQLCLHPGLVEAKAGKGSSAKLEALREYLTTITTEGHKVLVFSQFTSFLTFVRDMLDQATIRYVYLDGATKRRAEPIKQFQTDPAINVFLISLKAGGTGLNLTAADYCILLDPWWNPAVESQAIARAHRIGQQRSVTAYRFIMKNTIEEKVMKLQEKKRNLFENIIEEGDAFGSLITEDDIRGLF